MESCLGSTGVYTSMTCGIRPKTAAHFGLSALVYCRDEFAMHQIESFVIYGKLYWGAVIILINIEDRQHTYNVTLRCVRELLLPWKCSKYCIFACLCMHVALLIQHSTCVHHIVTSFVASPAPPHFSPLSHKQRRCRKKVIEHKMCVLIFSTTFV
jgi:hypothetical protein